MAGGVAGAAARAGAEPVPLRRNRDFQLLWAGQAVSALGGRISGVAFPLLVLETTGSPAKAGIVAFAGNISFVIATLPAGVLVDRWNRKLVMIACDTASFVALASIVVALWLDALTFAHIVFVAFVEGGAFIFADIAQRSALVRVVPRVQLSEAIAQNQAREYGALLAGPPAGGVLFGLGRLYPFLADAVSYLVSIVTLLLIRTDFAPERPHRRRRVHLEIAEGFAFLWRQPLLRVTSMLVMVSDLVLNSLFLVVIVVARELGASPALIGAMFVFVGVGGVLGAVVAPYVARRLAPRTVVIGAEWIVAILVPFLLVAPDAITLGLLFGAMFFAFPAWNAVIGAYRVGLTPDRLQGRVQAAATMLSVGPVPVGVLAVGFLLEHAGSATTIWILAAVMLVPAIGAAASAVVRRAPPLPSLASSPGDGVTLDAG